MSENETTAEMLAEIDRDMVEIETLVAELAREALQADYPQQAETTTEMLTETEGQADGITPDDLAGEALAGSINEWPSAHIVRREVEELQAELGRAKRRVVELETLVADLRTINDAQEKTVSAAGRQNVDLQHRLDVVSAEWAEQAATFNGLQQQLEAVKAELVQERLTRNHWQNHAQRAENELANKEYDCRQLRIELDALQQAPQAETAAAVPTSTEDRFEEGWDAGTARAVETIVEWLEPFRGCGSEALALLLLEALPHIMRSLTGLTPED